MEPARQQVFLRVLENLEKALTTDKLETSGGGGGGGGEGGKAEDDSLMVAEEMSKTLGQPSTEDARRTRSEVAEGWTEAAPNANFVSTSIAEEIRQR